MKLLTALILFVAVVATAATFNNKFTTNSNPESIPWTNTSASGIRSTLFSGNGVELTNVNATRATNFTMYGTSTNLGVEFYPDVNESQLAVEQVPNMYFLTTPYGITSTEAVIEKQIWNAGTNYLRYGFDTIQLDAGWSFRTNGTLVFHPVRFPTGTNMVKLAHSLGLKLIAYVNLTGIEGIFDTPDSYTNIDADAKSIVQMGFDGIKYDMGYTGTAAEQWAAAKRFATTLYKWADKPMYIASSHLNEQTNSLAYVIPFANRAYLSRLGATDTFSPHTWTNVVLDHWDYEVNQPFVRPGHLIEGAAWLSGWLATVPQTSHVQRVAIKLACLGAQPILYYAPTNFSIPHLTTNATFLEAWRNPYIVAPTLIGTNLTPGWTNKVWMRSLDRKDSDRRLVGFINYDLTNTVNFTVTANQLQFQTPIFTVIDISNQVVKAYATNSFTYSLGPTDVDIFVMWAGLYNPSNLFVRGTITAGDDVRISDHLYVTNGIVIPVPGSSTVYSNYVDSSSVWHLSLNFVDRATFNPSGVGWIFGNHGTPSAVINLGFGDLRVPGVGNFGSAFTTNRLTAIAGFASLASNNIAMPTYSAADGLRVTNATGLNETHFVNGLGGIVFKGYTNTASPQLIFSGLTAGDVTVLLKPRQYLYFSNVTVAGSVLWEVQ